MNRHVKVCLLIGVIAGLGVGAAFGQTIFGAAYVGSGQAAKLYSIDPTTGAATVIGSTGLKQLSALDFNPTTGVLYGVGADAGGNFVLATINTATGTSTTVDLVTNAAPFQDLAFSSNGTLYGLSEGGLYSINLTTAVTTLINPSTADFFGDGLSYGPGGVLFASTYSGTGASTMGLFSVDPTTGIPTHLSDHVFPASIPTNLSDIPRIVALGFHAGSNTMYATVFAGTGSGADLVSFFVTVDTTTGVVTNLGQTVAGMDAIAVYSIPEPPVPALLAAGLAMLAWRGRRRRTA